MADRATNSVPSPALAPTLLCLTVGGGGWLALSAASGVREAWDGPLYFATLWPAAIAVAFVLGGRFPRRPWRWPALLFGAQWAAAFATQPDASLLPLGTIAFGVLALPAALAATLASRRNRTRAAN